MDYLKLSMHVSPQKFVPLFNKVVSISVLQGLEEKWYVGQADGDMESMCLIPVVMETHFIAITSQHALESSTLL